MGLGVEIHLPVPTQSLFDCTEPDWRKSDWRRTAAGSRGYSVSVYSPKMRALVVLLIGKDVVVDNDGGGKSIVVVVMVLGSASMCWWASKEGVRGW